MATSAVQQIRFADRLTVKLCIDDASLPGLVTFMNLQPLVRMPSNTAFPRTWSSSVVVVETTVRQTRLQLRVSDNGPGFATTPGPRRHRIGLANTESRLREL